ncbi:unnamed protein product, partial [Ectocarpus sp. 8 AP-2014]
MVHGPTDVEEFHRRVPATRARRMHTQKVERGTAGVCCGSLLQSPCIQYNPRELPHVEPEGTADGSAATPCSILILSISSRVDMRYQLQGRYLVAHKDCGLCLLYSSTAAVVCCLRYHTH